MESWHERGRRQESSPVPKPGNCPALQEEQQNPIRQDLVLPTWTEKKKKQTHKKTLTLYFDSYFFASCGCNTCGLFPANSRRPSCCLKAVQGFKTSSFRALFSVCFTCSRVLNKLKQAWNWKIELGTVKLKGNNSRMTSSPFLKPKHKVFVSRAALIHLCKSDRVIPGSQIRQLSLSSNTSPTSPYCLSNPNHTQTFYFTFCPQPDQDLTLLT